MVDVAQFVGRHPGGAKLLSNYIGKDVTRFFHGAYSAENVAKVPRHVHSHDAKHIINQMVVGRYCSEASTRLVKICDVDGQANLSGSCKTIKFKEACEPMAESNNYCEDATQLIKKLNHCCPLTDINSMGKYYLIKSTSHPSCRGGATPVGGFNAEQAGIKRQYTDCFSMRSYVYRAIL